MMEKRLRRVHEVLQRYAACEADEDVREELDDALKDARWLAEREPGPRMWLLLGHVMRARWDLLDDADALDGAIANYSRAGGSSDAEDEFDWTDHLSFGQLLLSRFELLEDLADLDLGIDRLRMATGGLEGLLSRMRIKLADALATRFAYAGGGADRVEALVILDGVVERANGDPEDVVLAADAYSRLGEVPRGMALLAEVSSADDGPIGAEAAWDLALAHAGRYERSEGSLDDVEAAIGLLSGLLSDARLAGRELSPTEASCHAMLGLLLTWRSGIGLSAFPDEYDLFVALQMGQEPIAHDDLDAAIGHLTFAVERLPEDLDSALLLGVLMLATGVGPNDPALDLLGRTLSVASEEQPPWPRLRVVTALLRYTPGPDVPRGDERIIRQLESLGDAALAGASLRAARSAFLGVALASRAVDTGDEEMGGRGVAAFCDALQDLEPGEPLRAIIVVRLIYAMISMRVYDLEAVSLDRVASIMGGGPGRADPIDLVALELARGRQDTTDAVLTRTAARVAEALAAAVPEDPAYALLAIAVLPLFFERYAATQSLDYLDLVQRCADLARTLQPGRSLLDRSFAGMAAFGEVIQAVVRRDGRGAIAAAERFRLLMSDEYPREAGLFAAFAAAIAGNADGISAGLGLALDARTGAPPQDAVNTGQLAAMEIIQGVATHDPDLLSRGIERAREMISGPRFHIGSLTSGQAILGKALAFRHGLGGASDDDLAEALANLEEAASDRRTNPGAPYAAQIFADLSEAHRAESEGVGPAVDIALEGLRARLREVQLQSGSEHMLAISKAGEGEAVRVAGWCVADDRPGALVEALELGRGLVLQASISVRSVPDLLRAEGADALAAIWEVEATLKPEHRTRALTVLGDSALQRPATAAEIGAGLRATGADALAYLLPGATATGGVAVLVRAAGTTSIVHLPGFHQDGPVRRYAAIHEAYLAAYRTPEEQQARRDWSRALDEVCGWAGPAVMAPLLEQFTGTSGLPRLVLVPVGAAGVVPWHAARLGEVRVCERSVISYAASGRQLIDAAGRPCRPLLGYPVIVADPVGEVMLNSRRECAEIARLWYPEAVRLGRWRNEQARPATVPEVMSVLFEASMLHYSGHASSAAWAADSFLHLAGRDGAPDGERLAIKDILRSAAEPAGPGAVVVLTACLSDLTRESHDEALTLSTALLATVAVAVVGSRWLVADDPRTAAMMAMFHRHLALTPEDPALALHRTQRWMLDPAREMPGEISDRLRKVTEGLDFADPRIWAAFTHQGR
ncbi:CHAT domain-containing protein [Streptosporangiaceae bacterium NEAU-GS5]|nr:CHAT domain-containing protein [Streptosporangiaceae bacterium NEAU-GS5]